MHGERIEEVLKASASGRRQRPLRALLVAAHPVGADDHQHPHPGGPVGAGAARRLAQLGERRPDREPRVRCHPARGGRQSRLDPATLGADGAEHDPQDRARPLGPHLRQRAPGAVRRDGVRGAEGPPGPGGARRPRHARTHRPECQLPGRGTHGRGRRHTAQPRLRPSHRLHRGPRLPPAAVSPVLPRGGGDHERARGPSALGKAALPDRGDAPAALSAVGPVHRGARRTRPRPPLRQRLPGARARGND